MKRKMFIGLIIGLLLGLLFWLLVPRPSEIRDIDLGGTITGWSAKVAHAAKKISELTALGTVPETSDILPMVDLSANATKKVQFQNIWAYPRVPLTKTSNYTIGSNENRESYGGVFDNEGATGSITFTLPDAQEGMLVTIVLYANQDVNVDPNGTEQILSLTDTGGDQISSDATLGSLISLWAITSTEWMPVGRIGTWADAN